MTENTTVIETPATAETFTATAVEWAKGDATVAELEKAYRALRGNARTAAAPMATLALHPIDGAKALELLSLTVEWQSSGPAASHVARPTLTDEQRFEIRAAAILASLFDEKHHTHPVALGEMAVSLIANGRDHLATVGGDWSDVLTNAEKVLATMPVGTRRRRNLVDAGIPDGEVLHCVRRDANGATATFDAATGQVWFDGNLLSATAAVGAALAAAGVDVEAINLPSGLASWRTADGRTLGQWCDGVAPRR